MRLQWYFHSEEHYSIFIFWLPKTWRYYSEDITKKWRKEDIAVSSFSLYCTWCNDLRLYKLYISNYNNNNVYLLGHCCHLRPLDFDLPPYSYNVWWQRKIRGTQLTAMPSKWTLLLYSATAESVFCFNCFCFLSQFFNPIHFYEGSFKQW